MAAEEPAESYQEVVAIRLNSSEYALQAVFTQFEALADNKIKLMLSTSIVRYPFILNLIVAFILIYLL
jgi:hypothetical protein